MILFVYDKYRGNRTDSPNTDRLIVAALNEYRAETEAMPPKAFQDLNICRTQKGKPYVEGLSVHFSVSHSDHVWVCLVGEQESGVDIQNRTHHNYDAIAKRFFQPEEKLAVQEHGLEAFIGIWCRKEAFIKYYGLTIGEAIDWLDVARMKMPADEITHMGDRIYFTEVAVHQDYHCVAATGKKEQIWIRKIKNV